jgi:hypothetical protein
VRACYARLLDSLFKCGDFLVCKMSLFWGAVQNAYLPSVAE